MVISANPTRDEASPPREIGPYRIEGALSRGGMAIVYRGVHKDTGASAAVKTVLRVEEGLVASLRREIHALGRIDHPGVVKVIAHGVEDGIPWYAMELLTGRTLRDHLWDIRPAHRPLIPDEVPTREVDDAEVPNLPSPGPQKRLFSIASPPLQIVRRLCAPLAFLHGSGVVHRDLKPENIIVRPDGTPVLIDLGLAALSTGVRGREALEEAGNVKGTLPYMAPEQIRGELVDPRADLYSVGCILYECVTGSPPFQAASVDEFLRAHQEDIPRPLTERALSVPREISDLVARLLEKRPRDRPGHAEDVAAVLEAADAEGTPRSVKPPSPAYLYRPELVGREGAYRELHGAVQALAKENKGDLIYLGGESGVGKTRLAMEAVRQATMRWLTVVLGQCAPLGVGGPAGRSMTHVALQPFGPLLVAIADRCRADGEDRTAHLLGSHARVLAPYEPSLATLPGARDLPEPERLEPAAARARVLSALREVLLTFAAETPLLVVLDDLQWADDLTCQFLRETRVDDLAKGGALIIGTYRADEMDAAREPILRVPGARTIPIGRLSPPDVRKMVSGMLALHDAPAALMKMLEERCDGNPFFVAEYLRAAVATGLLARSRERGFHLVDRGAHGGVIHEPPELPSTLAELIEQRLSALSPAELSAVRCAAVLGREMGSDLLSFAMATDGDTSIAAVATLVQRQILEETRADRIRFVHDKVREIAYASIPEEERVNLHLRAAQSIRTLRRGSPESIPDLAHHLARAGVHEEAARHFAAAASAARARYANGEAIAFYRAAIESSHAMARSAPEAALRQTESRETESHETESRETANRETATDSAPPLVSVSSLGEGLGDLLSLGGQQEAAREAYTQAIASLPERERLTRARLLRKIGKAREIRHEHAQALIAYSEAEKALGDPPEGDDTAFWEERVQIYLELLWVGYWQNRVADMRSLVDFARHDILAFGTRYQRVRFFQLLVMMNLRIERYMPSEETLDHARAAMEAAGEETDAASAAAVRFVLFFALVLHGSLDEAESHGSEVLKVAERVGALPLRTRCLTYLALIARRRRNVEATRAWTSKSLSASTAGKMDEYLGVVKANQGWLALADGDLTGARSLAEEAIEIWKPQTIVYPLQWTALWPLMAIDLGRGAVESAVSRARSLLDPQQQRAPDEIERALASAVEALECGQSDLAVTHLERATDLAKDSGLL